MEETKKISYADPRIKEIINACFPDYRGRKVRVTNYIPSRLDSWWDGGSRDYFVFYQPQTRKVFHVHSNHPIFEPNQPKTVNPEAIPEDVLLVKHTIFCGRDIGITIHVKQEQMKLLE